MYLCLNTRDESYGYTVGKQESTAAKGELSQIHTGKKSFRSMKMLCTVRNTVHTCTIVLFCIRIGTEAGSRHLSGRAVALHWPVRLELALESTCTYIVRVFFRRGITKSGAVCTTLTSSACVVLCRVVCCLQIAVAVVSSSHVCASLEVLRSSAAAAENISGSSSTARRRWATWRGANELSSRGTDEARACGCAITRRQISSEQ